MRAGAAVVFAVLVLGVTGCGTDDDATTSPGPATTTPEATVPSDNTSPPENSPSPDERGPSRTPETESAEPSPDPEQTRPTRPPSDRLTPTPSPPPDAPPPVTGEVPEGYMDEVIADATQRSGVSAGDVAVRRSQAVTWRDGSLGCPEPGMMYTQALVDGYWVELDAGGKVYDYRLNERGGFRLCTNPAPTPPPDLRDRS